MPTRTRFTHHRNTVSPDVLEFFGRDIEFNASVDDLTFAAPIEHLPVVNPDPYLNRLLVKYCEEAFRASRRTSGLSGQPSRMPS